MSPVFNHGGLRLSLLALLEQQPRHGYELIRLLEDRFMGMYTPSAGTVYPRLNALEEAGLVEHDLVEGKKVYRLTDAGRAEVDSRRDEIDAVASDAVESALSVVNEIRDDVRAAVRDVRQELRTAARDVRREERRTARDGEHAARDAARAARDVAREARRAARDTARAARDQARVARDEARSVHGDEIQSLRSDLQSFVGDVIAAARQHDLDADRLRRLRGALLDARQSVLHALLTPPSQE